MAVAFDPDQDYTAKIDRRFNWTTRLAGMVGAPTITTATVTCPTAGVTIANTTHDTTTVTFRISSTGITTPTWVVVTCHVILSDGQEDDDAMEVHFTDT